MAPDLIFLFLIFLFKNPHIYQGVFEFLKDIFKLLDNTFLGTLLAGISIAYFGLHIYQKQKKLDSVYSKKQKAQEVAIILMTNLDSATKKYQAELDIWKRTNPVINLILEKITSIDKNFRKDDLKQWASKIIPSINESLEQLRTQLSLIPEWTNEVTVLLQKVGSLTFYLSTINTLPDLDIKTLNEIGVGITKEYSEARNILKRVASDET